MHTKLTMHIDLDDPVGAIHKLTAARLALSNSEILNELRAIEPLPDDGPAWDDDAPWERAYLLVALADVVAEKRIVDAVGPMLDVMPLGDPGEMMRGMRHAFEKVCSPDWNYLRDICISRCHSARAGTRYWALYQLGILKDIGTLPDITGLLHDSSIDVAIEAVHAGDVVTRNYPQQRQQYLELLSTVSRQRPELKATAIRITTTTADE